MLEYAGTPWTWTIVCRQCGCSRRDGSTSWSALGYDVLGARSTKWRAYYPAAVKFACVDYNPAEQGSTPGNLLGGLTPSRKYRARTSPARDGGFYVDDGPFVGFVRRHGHPIDSQVRATAIRSGVLGGLRAMLTLVSAYAVERPPSAFRRPSARGGVGARAVFSRRGRHLPRLGDDGSWRVCCGASIASSRDRCRFRSVRRHARRRVDLDDQAEADAVRSTTRSAR